MTTISHFETDHNNSTAITLDGLWYEPWTWKILFFTFMLEGQLKLSRNSVYLWLLPCQHVCKFSLLCIFSTLIIIFYNISYEMVLELYMFSLRMKGWVLYNMNGTRDVTIQLSIFLLLTQFLHEPMQPNHLFTSLCSNNILCFCC